jgi:hypothetical protein
MEALAQQVSRLQPSGNGMHQQNVLINIQQFPQAPPPPPPYQPPPMYHHPPQPMYHQPYQPYQPPNPLYYPPATGYPQHMPPPPPQPQMPQLGQPPMGQPPMGQPPSSQAQNMQQNQPYRQLAPRQQPPPRQMPPQRMPVNPRQPMNNQRQPMARQRAPMVRPRGGGMTAVRSIRPRMPMNQNGQIRQQAVKRTPEQIQALQAKKKRFDVLTPDKDDEDCQVICMQPKNTDGGLPQIQSVQVSYLSRFFLVRLVTILYRVERLSRRKAALCICPILSLCRCGIPSRGLKVQRNPTLKLLPTFWQLGV